MARHAAAQAHQYLDARQPGWEQRSQIELEATPAPMAEATKGAQTTLREIQANLRPATRHLADQFLALYTQWPKLSPGQRVARLTEIVNRGLTNMGVPPLEPRLDATLDSQGAMDPVTWELAIREDMVAGKTPMTSEFAYVCGLAAHEGRHRFNGSVPRRPIPTRRSSPRSACARTCSRPRSKRTRASGQALNRSPRVRPRTPTRWRSTRASGAAATTTATASTRS